MTFAEFCEAASDTPLNEFQKRTCDAIEEKYRKDGNFDNCAPAIMRGEPRVNREDKTKKLIDWLLEETEEIEL